MLVLIQQRRTTLYRPLCSVYTAGGDGSVPSPVFGLYNRGGQLSTVPCVFVFIHTECNRELWPNARRQQQNGVIPDAITCNISKHQVLLVGTRDIFVFSISQLSFFFYNSYLVFLSFCPTLIVPGSTLHCRITVPGT